MVLYFQTVKSLVSSLLYLHLFYSLCDLFYFREDNQIYKLCKMLIQNRFLSQNEISYVILSSFIDNRSIPIAFLAASELPNDL